VTAALCTKRCCARLWPWQPRVVTATAELIVVLGLLVLASLGAAVFTVVRKSLAGALGVCIASLALILVVVVVIPTNDDVERRSDPSVTKSEGLIIPPGMAYDGRTHRLVESGGLFGPPLR
jgi:hypothetical protein